MPTPPPKQNRGNRRSGAVKGTPSGRRRGQLAWHKDVLILERLNLVRTLKAQGYTALMMLQPVNEFMRRRNVPEITIETVYDDFGRIRQLLEQERAKAVATEDDLRQGHIEAFAEVKRQAWKAFHTTGDRSLNRSAYLNTIRSTEESIAKMDGSLAMTKALAETLDEAVAVEEARRTALLEQARQRFRVITGAA